MAYDICIGKNKGSAIQSIPLLSIEDDDFDSISELCEKIENTHSIRNMFRDYYSDSCFQNSDLERLRSEIAILVNSKLDGNSLKIFSDLFKIVDQALAVKNNIYCFSD